MIHYFRGALPAETDPVTYALMGLILIVCIIVWWLISE